jgi:hypothetical protein
LLALLSSARDWLRRGRGPEPSLIPGPIVRAAASGDGAPTDPAGSPPRIGGIQGASEPSAPVPRRLNLPPNDHGAG